LTKRAKSIHKSLSSLVCGDLHTLPFKSLGLVKKTNKHFFVLFLKEAHQGCIYLNRK